MSTDNRSQLQLSLNEIDCNKIGLCVLGSPVGHPSFIQKWLHTKLQALDTAAELILNFPMKHIQWNLLYWVFRSKINHLLRTVMPCYTETFVTGYDALKRKIFNRILDIHSISDSNWIQACLPIERGGFGLGFIHSIADTAYTSSCITSSQFITVVFPNFLPHDSEKSGWCESLVKSVDTINKFVDSTDHNITTITIDELLLSTNNNDNNKGDTTKLQSYLSSLMDKSHLKQFMTRYITTDTDKARMRSVGGKHAGAFLRALSKGVNEVSCNNFSVLCLFRLGMKLPFIPETLCCDCKSKTLIGERGEHLHCCTKDGHINHKHNSLVVILEKLCCSAGIKTRREPPHCFINSDSDKRPDIRLVKPNLNGTITRDILLDVSVTFPATASIITKEKTATKTGAAALAREKHKRYVYNEKAEENNFEFAPVVLETYGRWGKEFSDLFDQLVKHAWERSGKSIPHAVLKDYWKKRISMDLQINNAKVFLERTTTLMTGNAVLRGDEAQYHDNIRESCVRTNGPRDF